MREKWYVVPTRYALCLREEGDEAAPGDAGTDEIKDDSILDGLTPEEAPLSPHHTPRPRRKLPRKSSGRTTR